MDAPWGVMLEAELAGADVVRAHVLSHGPVEAPTWVRSREAPAVVFATRQEAVDAADTAWPGDRMFVLREVPALRLDTTAGRLLVVDRWGDSGFRPIAQRAGAGVLRLDTPVCTVLSSIDAMRSAAGRHAEITVVAIGWRPTRPVTRREPLAAWSSHGRVERTGLDASDVEAQWQWREEPNNGVGDGAWAAHRAFGQVNSREEILRSARLVDAAARNAGRAAVSASLDVDDVEEYLRSLARGGR